MDYLFPEETEELNQIFDRFKDRVLFEYPIQELKLVSFKNDLLGDKRELGTITLSKKSDEVVRGNMNGTDLEMLSSLSSL